MVSAQTSGAKEPAAAAVVTERGVTVRVYGPLLDRKREVYLLAYYNGSKRTKETVKGTLAAAKKRAKELCNGVAGGEIIDALHLTPLDRRVYITAKEACAKIGRAVDHVCRDAAEAFAVVGPGVSFLEVARFWKSHHAQGFPLKTPTDIAAELLEWMKGKRRADVTVKTLKSIYTAFGDAFPMPLAHVTSKELDDWLTSHRKHSARTQENYRRALVRLWNYARGKYIPLEGTTAAERLEVVSDDHERRGAVQIFRPWEMERILAHAPPELLPCIVLGAFGGLRTIELSRIEWSAIRLPDPESDEKPDPKFPHGFIEITKAVAKRHRAAARRIIPIQSNLAEWLQPYRFRSGAVSPYKWDVQISDAITALINAINRQDKKAKRREISRPPNGLRHSYGSYRLPVIENAAALALEMNNSVRQIIESYREVVFPADVKAWWEIRPKAPAQIIQLELLG